MRGLLLICIVCLALHGCEKKAAAEIEPAPQSVRGPVPLPPPAPVHDLAAYFKDLEAEYDATFVLYDAGREQYSVYNEKRARTGFLPASTFKILNALIGLESGVIENTEFVVEWDGTVHPLPEFNRDHSLRSAMRDSVVWYFQELARRVGLDRMRYYLRRSEYGNGNLSAGVDAFWLYGPFRITAYEQVRFLVRFRNYRLPFSRRTIDAVRSLLVVEAGPGYVLRAKTGLLLEEGEKTPALAWWVGYVERHDNVYYFALNMEAPEANNDFVRARTELPRRILKSLKIL